MNTSATAPSLNPEQTFEQLGRITRKLHEALSELGLDQGLMEITREFPDARERLGHVGHMTEAAANKVLNLVELAQPQCHNFKRISQSPDTTAEQLRAGAAQFSDAQNAVLSDIMMTQDFQDLSGQVIKKVIEIISATEQQLLSLLLHSVPEERTSSSGRKNELAGPQVPDKALQQDDVDDLLASLGF